MNPGRGKRRARRSSSCARARRGGRRGCSSPLPKPRSPRSRLRAIAHRHRNAAHAGTELARLMRSPGTRLLEVALDVLAPFSVSGVYRLCARRTRRATPTASRQASPCGGGHRGRQARADAGDRLQGLGAIDLVDVHREPASNTASWTDSWVSSISGAARGRDRDEIDIAHQERPISQA